MHLIFSPEKNHIYDINSIYVIGWQITFGWLVHIVSMDIISFNIQDDGPTGVYVR